MTHILLPSDLNKPLTEGPVLLWFACDLHWENAHLIFFLFWRNSVQLLYIPHYTPAHFLWWLWLLLSLWGQKLVLLVSGPARCLLSITVFLSTIRNVNCPKSQSVMRHNELHNGTSIKFFDQPLTISGCRVLLHTFLSLINWKACIISSLGGGCFVKSS